MVESKPSGISGLNSEALMSSYAEESSQPPIEVHLKIIYDLKKNLNEPET